MSSFRVRLPGQSQGLAVSASPVDTFQYPTQQSQLSQLAGALAEVAPKVGRFSDTLAAVEEQKAKDRLTALAAQNYKDGKRTLAEVQRGEIAPYETALYWGYFEEQFGKLASADFAARLNQHIENTPGAGESIDGFDKAASEFTAQFEQGLGANTGSEFFQAGYQQSAATELNRLRMQVAQNVGVESQKTMMTRNPAVIRQVILDGKKNGLAPEAIVAEINKQGVAMRALLPGKAAEIDEDIAKAIVEAGLSERDDELVRTMLDGVKRTDGGSMRATRAGITEYDRVKATVAALRIQDDTQQSEAVQARVNVVRTRVGLKMIDLFRDPRSDSAKNADFDALRQELYEAGDIDAAQTVQRMRTSNLRTSFENPDLVDDLTIQATEGRIGIPGLGKFLEEKKISRETYARLTQAAQEYTSISMRNVDRIRNEGRTVAQLAMQNAGYVVNAINKIADADSNKFLGGSLRTRFYAAVSAAATAEMARTGVQADVAFFEKFYQQFVSNPSNRSQIQNITFQLSQDMGPQGRKAAADSVSGNFDPNADPAQAIVPPRTLQPEEYDRLAAQYATGNTSVVAGLSVSQINLVRRKAAQILTTQQARTPTSNKKP